MPAAFASKCLQQDGVLAEESRKRRNACDGQGGDKHGAESVSDGLPQAAHAEHVLFAAHGVNDGASGEEEQCLEEGVSHQVENACAECTDSASEEHVAELADGGVSENFLDVGLYQADGGGEER